MSAKLIEQAVKGKNIEALITSDGLVVDADRIDSGLIHPKVSQVSQLFFRANSTHAIQDGQTSTSKKQPQIFLSSKDKTSMPNENTFNTNVIPEMEGTKNDKDIPLAVAQSNSPIKVGNKDAPTNMVSATAAMMMAGKRHRKIVLNRQNPTEKIKKSIEEASVLSVPKSLRLQIMQECAPIVTKMRRAYESQLGDRHPISMRCSEHEENIYKEIKVLTFGQSYESDVYFEI